MNASNRIILNTLAQYARTIINMVLSLYSSRLVLEILGVEDYGVYSLVAGVVSMLSFLTNSLVGSTQRFLSVSQGHGSIERLKQVFSNSLLLHIVLGLAIVIILASFTPWIFNGFLNIPIERINAAEKLYLLVVLMVYVSFLASPYRALLVSHENIIYTSIIDVFDGILKVVLVMLLPYSSIDKILAYGFIMLGIQFFNLLAFLIYSHLTYEECIFPKIRLFSFTYIKELSSFTGWMLYSSICITVRTQGLAVVLNKIYGAAINAAYGIGSQISGMVSFISSSFNNAVAPQLMAAEGGGERKRMLTLAMVQSKTSFLLLAMIGIPTIFEMQSLLELWLVDVPQNTMLFGRVFLSMQIVVMLSIGLGTANKAIGNVGRYTLLTFTPKLLILPLAWYILTHNGSFRLLGIVMFAVEAICMLLRVYLFRKESWFDAFDYCVSVILRSLVPVLISCITCFIVQILISSDIRILYTYTSSITLFLLTSYIITLNRNERIVVKSIIKKIFKR